MPGRQEMIQKSCPQRFRSERTSSDRTLKKCTKNSLVGRHESV